MKKLIMVNISVLLIMFLTASVNVKPNTDTQSVEHLLEERIAILNHFYGGKMAFDDARNNLEKISADSLLKEDVSLMKAFDGSEVDHVAEFHIEITECGRTSYGVIKGKAEISWLMQGQREEWDTVESYYFTAEDDQGTIKLTQLKKL